MKYTNTVHWIQVVHTVLHVICYTYLSSSEGKLKGQGGKGGEGKGGEWRGKGGGREGREREWNGRGGEGRGRDVKKFKPTCHAHVWCM